MTMTITLNSDYKARVDNPLLGYQGETNARTIDFNGLQVDRADKYVMRITYPFGVAYDLDITDGTYTVEGSVLCAIGTVKAQIMAYATSGEKYVLVKKSNIFELMIKPSISGEIKNVPSYEKAIEISEKVLESEKNARESADIAIEKAQYVSENLEKFQADIDGKVDKADGKGLSTNDYTDSEKEKVAEIDNKVDKIEGKGLSTNDYTDEDKSQVAQNKTDILSLQNGKVDKEDGKGLSTNDLTDTLKSSYDETVNKAHTHDNKETIDKLAVNSDGNLTYDGNEIGAGVSIDDNNISTSTTWSSDKINYELTKFTPKGTKVGTVTNIKAKASDQTVSLTWTDPDDVTVNDIDIKWKSTKLVYKAGSYPASSTDGTVALENTERNKYQTSPFTISGLTNGTTYYFSFFTYTEEGVINDDESQRASATPKAYTLYGFKLDQNESDPASMITYTESNTDFTPAHMNYNTGVFDYGSWGDAWFIKGCRPCVLGFDGTVKCYLNPNNYAKDVDGNPVNIASTSLDGNVMIEIPKVYWKIVDNGDDTMNFYISDAKVDDNYVCWSHIDNNGDEIEYCYMPAYNGYKDSNGKMRSLSGQTPTTSTTATQEITYAKANNTTDDVIWYTEVLCDRQLINILLMLIGRSTDTKSVFGQGNTTRNSVINTGTGDTKGLFWGSNGTTSVVKVFGMENWWGNIYRRIAGWTISSGYSSIKLTYGTSDGSTTTGYNTDGSGYLKNSIALTSSGYIDKMCVFNNCILPKSAKGSASTYYCDNEYSNSNSGYYAFVGGRYGVGSYCGAFCGVLSNALSYSDSYCGSALSCKPLLQKG